jgi:hypothetical protein
MIDHAQQHVTGMSMDSAGRDAEEAGHARAYTPRELGRGKPRPGFSAAEGKCNADTPRA